MSIEMLDRMHDRCIAKMKRAKADGRMVKFWTLAQVDIRILQAKFKSI